MTPAPVTARRFAWLGLLLAGVAALALAWTALAQIGSLAAREGQARAQLLADGISQQIQRAVALGIPLERLEGVQTLFKQRIGESPEIEALALVDAQQRVLWAYPPQAAPASQRVAAQGTVAPVSLRGQPVARVLLLRRAQGPAALLLQWAPLLLCAVLATALAATEGVRYAVASGPRLREKLLRSMSRSVAAGDFSRRLPVLRRRSFDGRLPWLAAELRQVNEQHLRLSRLVHSLRQTEPDAVRRAELDAALVHASGRERFAEGSAREVLPLPYAAAARWLGVLGGWLAWCLAGTAAMLCLPATEQGPGPVGWVAWGLSVALLAGALLHALARLPWERRRLGCERGAWSCGGLVGGLLIGPGWVLLLGTLAPGVLQRLRDLAPGLAVDPASGLAAVLGLGCLLVLAWPRRAASRAVDAEPADAA